MGRTLADPRLAPVGGAAISVALFTAPWLLGPMGIMASVWSPLPVALVYRRQGAGRGRLALLLATAGALGLMSLAGGPASGLYYLFYGALALGLGEAAVRGLSDDRGLALGAGAGLGVILALALAAGMLAGAAPEGEGRTEGQARPQLEGTGPDQPSSGTWEGAWQAYWQRELEAVEEIYRRSGLNPQQLAAVRQVLRQTVRVLLFLGPGVLAAGALLIAWANLLLLRRLERERTPRGELITWRSPYPLVWLFIAGATGMVLGEGAWFWVGANLVLVLGVIYFFQGCAVLAYWLDKKGAPRLLRVGIYLLVALEFFLAVVIALAGLFDLWFNFRRLPEGRPA